MREKKKKKKTHFNRKTSIYYNNFNIVLGLLEEQVKEYLKKILIQSKDYLLTYITWYAEQKTDRYF